ncbi:hypothetical protein BARVI_09065 [Barnesiella viscericola DSM 18177]|uniref:Uncharacterized protein n=1 Tax=Barnesiella viscericola DSM 18177 TaxID=880074 RepID=W0EXF9_9BACT|nr:hypothetical protein BARVI_09065 [Barnesiella viscericola DSM 18177]
MKEVKFIINDGLNVITCWNPLVYESSFLGKKRCEVERQQMEGDNRVAIGSLMKSIIKSI